MDKNTATHLIESTFNQAFSEARFELFIKNFLNEVEPVSNQYSVQYLGDDYKDHVNSYKLIGKYTDPVGEALDILIIEVKSVLKLDRARTALRNFAIKHLAKFEKDYALVAFYSKQDEGADWRFSFIKLEHQAYVDNEKGIVKTRKEFTPAKRYSFLVGKYEKTYTAINQLLPILQNVSSNATIEEIENAFSIEKVTDEFFSQYKDLFCKLYENFMSDVAMQNELTKSNIDTSRFTKKLLGQIVFLYFLQKKGWLGVPKDKTWGNGEKHFIQKLFETSKNKKQNFFKDYLQYLFYEALAKERNNIDSYYEKFDCRIPFLNGGLFEAEYDWQNANISIPESIFRNFDKNKSGDTGTGILDVFDRYNFTIKEDEPLDKEVAVDPEMLGKVFENMLEITERRSKGAYYTPREIVHYMCQESLIHYLDNSLNCFTENSNKSLGKQTNIYEYLDKTSQYPTNLSNQIINVPKTDIESFIRYGYSALLHDQSIVKIGVEIPDYKFILPESIRQHADLIDKKLTEIRICDPAIGSGAFPVGLLHELINAHLVIKPYLSINYLTEKLKIIKGLNNNEELSESRYIYRLKRHIIQESIYGVDIDASAIDIARLRLWLSLVVDEDDLEPVETLPNLDYKIVCGNSLVGFPENWNSPAFSKIEKLKDEFFNETNQNRKEELKILINKEIKARLESSEKVFGYKIDFDFKLFFSEVWRDKGGFDVVIGNPPFRVYKLIKNLEKSYDTYSTNELYAFFFEKSIKGLLRNNGVISLITGSLYLKGMKFEPLRTFLLNSSFPYSIEIKGDTVFENVQMPTCIYIGNKTKKEWRITDFIHGYNTLNKIETNTLPLEEFVNIQRGFEIGRDKVLEEKTDYPFITGSDVRPWQIKNLKYIDHAIFQEYSKNEKYFNQPRVLIRETGSDLTSIYLEEFIFCNRSLYSMIAKPGYGIEYLKYINLVLNSEISQYYYTVRFKSETEIFPKIRIGQAKLLPIKIINEINPSISIINDYLRFCKSCDQIIFDYFKHIANCIIYEIYFPTELIAANKEIIKHLIGLKPLYINMNYNEKHTIMKSEFERLYNPNHPVRNNVETLDSIEEVRIIKEALK